MGMGGVGGWGGSGRPGPGQRPGPGPGPGPAATSIPGIGGYHGELGGTMENWGVPWKLVWITVCMDTAIEQIPSFLQSMLPGSHGYPIGLQQDTPARFWTKLLKPRQCRLHYPPNLVVEGRVGDPQLTRHHLLRNQNNK